MIHISTGTDYSDLKNALFAAVAETIIGEASLAIAFSGGVDSSLLAKICKDLGLKVILLTIGFPESNDIEFSKGIASKMGLSHKIHKLNKDHFRDSIEYVRQKIGCQNISHIENCVAYTYIARLASENESRLILTANGCDELFCGYNIYRLMYNHGKTRIMELMTEKIENECILMKEVDVVTTEFGVNFKQPFLSRNFISFAKHIPIDQKIRHTDDLVRKHILREAALSIGVPRESAMRPKKALQYSSLIHKNFNRLLNQKQSNYKDFEKLA
ncbi:MAG: asparagine synthase C-terminal domain-containing protein [Nitrososphaeraceae archaeon]